MAESDVTKAASKATKRLKSVLKQGSGEKTEIIEMISALSRATKHLAAAKLQTLLEKTEAGKVLNQVRKLSTIDSGTKKLAKGLVDEWKQTIRTQAAGGSSDGASEEWPRTDKKVEWPVNKTRVRRLSTIKKLKSGECVLYWMSRDQRAEDNWAMLYARQLADQQELPLVVVFSLVPKFLNATERQYGFMLKGLRETACTLSAKRIPFLMLSGYAKDTIPSFVEESNVSAVVTDMSPLRVPMAWAMDVAAELDKQEVPLFQVDAHNIVPVWEASDKQEYAARTIRKKITDKLTTYLTELPALAGNDPSKKLPNLNGEPTTSMPQDKIDFDKLLASLEIDRTVKEVEWCVPGARAALKNLNAFCDDRLYVYEDSRNDPNEFACSGSRKRVNE